MDHIIYDLVYVASTIVSVVLHIYLIKVAHLIITEGWWFNGTYR